MIILSKLDGTPILVPPESIKFIEQAPDSILFFLNDESIIVKEDLQEIQNRVLEYKRQVMSLYCQPDTE